MPLSDTTRDIQNRLGRYVRDGKEPQLPGVTSGRLGTYRRLVYNVIDDSLRTAYPLTEKLLSPKEWDLLVGTFFNEHDCQEFQVMRMPRELAAWEEKPTVLLEDHPALEDLLWFEWAEVELYIMEDRPIPPHKALGDWWTDHWVLNPESQILQLTYPVHRTPPENLDECEPGSFFCLAFRQPKTYSIQFVDLSAIWVELLRLVGEGTHPAKAIQWLSEATGLTQDAIKAAAPPLLEDLKERGFFLGYEE
ncbi:MAG: putative DNA-binding domain-containing protein [Bacteroidota bacterium]|nr:putative DNA-binding domain-containing protein [Bacteroidota bacterium]MDX5505177.1 putative DNA-binding domain-containing protein [Bacteroidota bacterium]